MFLNKYPTVIDVLGKNEKKKEKKKEKKMPNHIRNERIVMVYCIVA